MSKSMDRINKAGPAVFTVLAETVNNNAEAVVTLCRALSCLRKGKLDADALRQGLELAIKEVDDVTDPLGGPDSYVDLMEKSHKGGIN